MFGFAYTTQTLQLKWHPDRNTADADATAKFQQVTDAYFVLSDKERRSTYDEEHNFVFDQTVNPISVFAEIFNDLMVPEVPNPSYWWQVGRICIAGITGIVANQYVSSPLVANRNCVWSHAWIHCPERPRSNHWRLLWK